MKSKSVGNALQNLMNVEGLTNDQMALDLHIDTTVISKMRHDKRNMQPDIAKASVDMYDNEFYTLELAREFTSGRTAPRVNGNAVDFENPLAVLLKTKNEIEEALESINIEMFLKRPDLATKEELSHIDVFIKELKESAWWSQNLIAALVDGYQRSGKKLNDEVTRKWKATEVIK